MALFSNLVRTGKALTHRSDGILTSASLVAGTTVGAGILALPAVTLPAGVVPSTLVLLVVWLYMLASGLLIAEANLWAMKETNRPDIGLLGTIQAQLGKGGVLVAGVLYIFIHYALLVAYIARGGDLLAEAVTYLEGLLGMAVSIPLWWGHVAFALLFGGLLYWGSERLVGRINSALLAVVIGSFAVLLVLCVTHLEPARWSYQNWHAASGTIPVVAVAFVYHNVVPVVTTQLEGDVRKVRWAIGLGALVPLIMFVAWNALMLGSVDVERLAAVTAIGVETDVLDPIEILRQERAHPALGWVISFFSEFAITTSFIGFVYGLLNVFRDIESFVFRDHTEDKELSQADEATPSKPKSFQKPLRYALVLLPPVALSVTSPDIFFSAIDFAGAFGNSILFGIIPAVMAWKMRPLSTQLAISSVPGGRLTLAVMIGLAASVIVQNAALALQ